MSIPQPDLLASLLRLPQSPGDLFLILLVPLLFDLPRTLVRAAHALRLHAERKKATNGRGDGPPSVSVVIPVHDGEKTIGLTLESLLDSGYSNAEFIVVDDCSRDGTSRVASEYAKLHRVKVFRREAQVGGKALALNYGLLFARGELVVAVDADTLVERGAIARLVQEFSDPEVGAVAGNVKVLNVRNLLTELQAYEYGLAMEVGRSLQSRLGALMVVPGAFGGFRRSLLSDVGSYDAATVTEDFDLTLKVLKAGMKTTFCPQAVAWTQVPERWREWVRQRTRWSRGQLQTLWRHRNVLFRRAFGRLGWLVAPDMLFTDVVLLFLRAGWVALLALNFHPSLLGVWLLTITLYLGMEGVNGLAVRLASPGRRRLWLVVPLMVLVYRPLYSLVRLKAYVEAMFGVKRRW